MISSGASRDVLKLLSGTLVARLFGLASITVFARLLSKHEMAVFPAYLMLTGLSSLVLTLGIFSLFTRDIPSLMQNDSVRMRSLIITGSAVILLGTVPIVVLSLWLGGPIAGLIFRDTGDAWIVRFMAPAFLAAALSQIAEYVMWGRGQFGATSLVQIFQSILRPLATLTFYFFFGFQGVVIGLVTAEFISACAGLWCTRDVFFGPLPPIYPLRELISESMPFYIGNYLTYLRGDGDSLLVAALLGPGALAEYYIAKILYGNALLLLTAVDKVAVQRLARFVRTPVFLDNVRSLHVQVSEILVPFSLLLIAIAPGLMSLIGGTRYANTAWPAVILLFAMLVQYIGVSYNRAIYVALPGSVRLKFTALEAFVVIVSTTVLAPLAGIAGVAGSRVIAALGIWFFGAMILRRHLEAALPIKPVLVAVATALPGTVLAQLLSAPSHDFRSAILTLGQSAAIWTASFLGLTVIFNRRLFELLGSEMTRRYREVFSS